jgi:hypothetical protein
VFVGVVAGSIAGMLLRMGVMCHRGVGVVRRLFMVPRFVVFRGVLVMLGCLPVVLGCLLVRFRSFL